jgi:hypothetical protein
MGGHDRGSILAPHMIVLKSEKKAARSKALNWIFSGCGAIAGQFHEFGFGRCLLMPTAQVLF